MGGKSMAKARGVQGPRKELLIITTVQLHGFIKTSCLTIHLEQDSPIPVVEGKSATQFADLPALTYILNLTISW